VFPPLSLCTDNGVMPAWAGVEKIFLGLSDDIESQEVVPRWPLGSRIVGPYGEKKTFKRRKYRGGGRAVPNSIGYGIQSSML
jgi:hypothetical protein